MNTRRVFLLMLGLILIFGLLMISGCAQESVPDQVEPEEEEMLEEKFKVAVVIPGRVDDVSWNQSVYESILRLQDEMGDEIDLTYVEGVYDVADGEATIRDFAFQGYDLIIGHGFQYMEPIIKMAPEFPEVAFAVAAGYKFEPNVANHNLALEQGGYIMGYITASLTETNKIGLIGGVDVVSTYRGHEGFKLGAKLVNPNVEIQEVYTGDWTDAAKAKEAALAMYDSGVDVIWTSGDGVGLGVIEAAKERDKLVLANVMDTNVLAPDNVVTSVVYNWTPVFKDMITDIKNNNFTNVAEKVYWISVANDGLRIAPWYGFEDKVPQEVKDGVEELIKNFKDGTLVLPDLDK